MSLSDQATYAPAAPPAVPDCRIWRLSVGQYHDMFRAGILTDDDPVELLEGWLVPKMYKNPPHTVAMELGREKLSEAATGGWHLRVQAPVTLARSEPEPDFAIVRGGIRDYLGRHPGPEAVALVVEVADASLHSDRSLKKRIYAEAGIPRYWIVNLVDRQVEVFSDPTGSGAEADYRRKEIFGVSDTIPFSVEGSAAAPIAAKDLLP